MTRGHSKEKREEERERKKREKRGGSTEIQTFIPVHAHTSVCNGGKPPLLVFVKEDDHDPK